MNTRATTDRATDPSTTEQLIADLKSVVSDAEALLKATSGEAGERIQEARAQAEASLKRARERLTHLEEQTLRSVREMADATDEYVRENPWQSVGVAAGLGLLLGLLIGRR